LEELEELGGMVGMAVELAELELAELGLGLELGMESGMALVWVLELAELAELDCHSQHCLRTQ
jgi:hypothetical protein